MKCSHFAQDVNAEGLRFRNKLIAIAEYALD
jgi:hypothetical protein